jgi:hypothetical protein
MRRNGFLGLIRILDVLSVDVSLDIASRCVLGFAGRGTGLWPISIITTAYTSLALTLHMTAHRARDSQGSDNLALRQNGSVRPSFFPFSSPLMKLSPQPTSELLISLPMGFRAQRHHHCAAAITMPLPESLQSTLQTLEERNEKTGEVSGLSYRGRSSLT